MRQTFRLGGNWVALTRKDVKHLHLSVHPPAGRVTLVAPLGTRPEVARAYAASKLFWIRQQQAKLHGQVRIPAIVIAQSGHRDRRFWAS